MRPVDLPAVRDAFARYLNDPLAGETTTSSAVVGPAELRRTLRAARLFWVAQPMAELAREVAEHEIAETRWMQDDRPSECGFMVVEGGIGPVPAWRTGETATARALAWGPHPDGEKLSLIFLIAKAEAEEIMLRSQELAAARFRGPALTLCAADTGVPVARAEKATVSSRALGAGRIQRVREPGWR